MTILAGDIKLVASQVMADTDNGGGAPTSNIITDGTSNGIFLDISELDRAGGSVSMRKVFSHVQTDNKDTFLGANVIVAKPPADPLVDVYLLASTMFERRTTNAVDVLESVYTIGEQYDCVFADDGDAKYPAGSKVIYLWFKGLLSASPFTDGQSVYLQMTSNGTKRLNTVVSSSVVEQSTLVGMVTSLVQYQPGYPTLTTNPAESRNIDVTKIQIVLANGLATEINSTNSLICGAEAACQKAGVYWWTFTHSIWYWSTGRSSPPLAPYTDENTSGYEDNTPNTTLSASFESLPVAGTPTSGVFGIAKTTASASTGASSVVVDQLFTTANPLGANEILKISQGSFAVLGHTATITATVSNGQTVNCSRVRLSRVRVVGNDGQIINTGYSHNLDAGTVTFSNVSGYAQPVKIEHSIEDMLLVNAINTTTKAVTFSRSITHDFPSGSCLSSALVGGNLQASIALMFDQATWNGTTWLDAVSGAAATGTFNDVGSPIGLTNKGTVTERWALQFTNSTTFNIIGEHVGVIGTGTTGADCAPINPATGVPYFTVLATGWGIGWAVGNTLRFNTIGAVMPYWAVRIVLPGEATVPDDSFTLLTRGDVDTP